MTPAITQRIWEELRPRYVSSEVRFYDTKDLKHIGCCLYNRLGRDDYSLAVYFNPCSTAQFDKNGNFIAGYGLRLTASG